MDYNEIMYYFRCNPENNKQDRLLLENLRLYEEEFKKILQNIEFDEMYEPVETII